MCPGLKLGLVSFIMIKSSTALSSVADTLSNIQHMLDSATATTYMRGTPRGLGTHGEYHSTVAVSETTHLSCTARSSSHKKCICTLPLLTPSSKMKLLVDGI